MIYYHLWHFYMPNLKVVLDKLPIMKSFRFDILFDMFNNDKRHELLLRMNDAFAIMKYFLKKPDNAKISLVLRYGYFNGEIHEFEDIWELAWKLYIVDVHKADRFYSMSTDYISRGLSLESMFLDSRFVERIPVLLLWDMLIFPKILVSSMGRIASKIFRRRLRKKKELQILLDHFLVDLKVSDIEKLCSIFFSQLECSGFVRNILTQSLLVEKKLAQMMLDRTRYLSPNTLRAVLICSYINKSVKKGISYKVSFTKDPIKNSPEFSLAPTKSGKMDILPGEQLPPELDRVVDKWTINRSRSIIEASGILIIEEFLNMGYRCVGFYELENNEIRYKKDYSESIKQNFYI